MLLCPTCYYGSARKNDIDFPTFVMLFDAIFRQGLARPELGIRASWTRSPKSSVNWESKADELRGQNDPTQNGKVSEIVLENGESLTSDYVISTCGAVETEALLEPSHPLNHLGRKIFHHGIDLRIRGKTEDFGWEETVIFFNDSEYSTTTNQRG